MKKYIISFLTILLVPGFVFAAGNNIENKCKDSSVGCAFCVYSYSQESQCASTFSVTYKNDSTPLEYETYKSGSNSGYVNCTFSYTNFTKNDFLDSAGNIICPNAKSNSEILSSGGRTANIKVTFSSDSTGSLKPTADSKIVNKSNEDTGDENPNGNKESYSCQYGNLFSVSIINEKIYITLNGYEDFAIGSNLNVNKFKNNNCPDLYYYANTRGSKIFSIYDEYPGSSYYSKISGTLIDENTGEEVPNPPEDRPISQPDYVNKLNYNNLCANSGIGEAAKIIGYIVVVAKWIVPLIIIVLGMIDFGKAVISSDDKAINKAASTLIRRIIAGIIVFFVPTIVLATLNFIKITGGIENATTFEACTKCILDAPKYCSLD